MSNLTERYAQRAITKTLGVHLGVQGIKNAILKANINFLKTNKVTRLFLIHNNIAASLYAIERITNMHSFSRIKAHGIKNNINRIAMIIVILP